MAAGIAALVIAAILAINGLNAKDSCTLSVAAVGTIAAAAHRGESADVVIGSAAFAPACSSFVKTVINEPEEHVEVEVEGPAGESGDFNGSGEELVSPAAAAPPSSAVPNFQRILDCVRSYEQESLVELCSNELIEPIA